MVVNRSRGKFSWLCVPSSVSPSLDKVVYGVVLVVLVWPGFSSLTQPMAKQNVVMQILVPYQASLESKLQYAHKSVVRSSYYTYRRLKEYFGLETWLNFLKSETPDEILSLFCNEIFTREVNTLLVINYGASEDTPNKYILNLAKRLGYPVISWDPNYPGALESDKDSRVLQIAPTIYHQCQAMIKILNRYNWTDFSIVTTANQDNDFVSCMKDMVVKTSEKQGFITKAKYKILSVVEIDLDASFDDDDDTIETITTALQTLIRTVTRVVLLHAGQNEALQIMETAKNMSLTESEYMWLLTSTSIGWMGSRFRTAKFPLGTLGISYNSSQDMIQESMKTAVKVWVMALNKMATYPSRLRELTMYPNNSCNASNLAKWKDGYHLYKAMQRTVIDSSSSDTMVSFNENGVIKNVRLNIYNVRPSDNRRNKELGYGQWDLVGDIVPKKVDGKIDMDVEMDEVLWPGGSVYPPKGKPDKRFFRVVTLKESPYITYISPDPATGLCSRHSVPCKLNQISEPNAYKNVSYDADGMVEYCCTGFCVDLLNILSERMNFDYEMYEVNDRAWGIKKNNTWNGLIKDMLDEKADMVITSIKINHQRATAMDFSTPFLETGITIMVALRKGAISATAFLEPYDYPSWCLILVFSVHATGASIFIFEWMSPSGLNKGRTPLREHKFSLFRSFWLIWAMLFGASVTTDNPRGTSSRFLANVWALFALVFLASYTANLAAFMITIDEYYDLTGIEDWRLMNPTSVTPHFRFATISGGSTEDNLRKSYPEMHRYMQKFNQSGVKEGIEALKTGKIHAFIYDATVLEYEAGLDNDCELITVGKWYAMTGYGVGFPKGSPYIDEVNEIILNLQKEGELDRMVKFWLAGACHAKKDKKDKSSHNIGILNFTSAFILLATGVLLGTILLLLEHCYFKFGRKCLKKYDKTGCCSLVSLSMGKSLTFEQSVMDAIDYHKKHRCKDPLCETQLWKAKHELDLALMKIDRLRDELSLIENHPGMVNSSSVHVHKQQEPNGNSSLMQIKKSHKESLYETPDSVRKRENNHVVHLPEITYKTIDAISDKENMDSDSKGVVELSDIDKRRLQFRRSPSYTNAMSTDSDKDNNSGNHYTDFGLTKTSSFPSISDKNSSGVNNPPISYAEKQFSPRRCPSYSQAVEDSPMGPLFHSDSYKQNTRTRYYDGKYYVGVAANSDDSAL